MPQISALEKGLVNKLIRILEKFPTSDMIIQTVFWVIPSLFKRKPFPDWEKIRPLLPVLHQYISEDRPDEFLIRALTSLSEISAEKIQEIIDEGFIPILIKRLFNHERVAHMALRALGNLTTGTRAQTIQLFAFKEFMPKLFEFTQSKRSNLQKEAFWIISNLTAEGSIYIDIILIKNDFLSKIKNGVVTAPPDVAAEAGWAIRNMISSGNKNQVNCAIKDHKIMESFAAMLMLPNPKLKQDALDTILMVMKTTGDNGEYIYIKDIEEAKLIDIIKNLAEESEFSEKAKAILEFFSENQQCGNSN